jgi:hypothetical protein
MLRSSQRPVLMILRAIILSVWTLVATASLAPLAIAQPWITEPPCETYQIECLDSDQVQKRRQYYRSHARVRPSPEQRLSNGVAWDLLVDAPTGLAIPRITWMSDQRGMRTANWLFEAIQGDLLLEYAEWEEAWGDQAKESAKTSEFRDARVLWQPHVALTYATSRLVSYVEVRIHHTFEPNVMLPWIIGRVLDLKQGTISSIEPCWGSSLYETGGLFRFGDLLEVCDPDSRDSFLALWERKFDEAKGTAGHANAPYGAECKKGLEPFMPSFRQVALYLTPEGLGVYYGSFWQDTVRHCLIRKSAINPVIIPYRELEPFMQPGPLRDELLK